MKFSALFPYELINFLVVSMIIWLVYSRIMFRIYLRPVCVGATSRCQSLQTASYNFHPSSSITRYRLVANGNNSAPKSSSCVKEKEKRRESEIRSIFFPSFDKKIEFHEIECLQIQTLTNENCQQQSALKLFFLRLRDLFTDGQMDTLGLLHIIFSDCYFAFSYLIPFLLLP